MALASPPSTPPTGVGSDIRAISAPPTTFDIASHYRDLIAKDATLTPPIAAIESLIALLSSNPLTTISETLALLSHQSSILLASQPNPIPLSAGTELFQRYLVSSFQQRPSSLGSADFTSLRNHLITNSRVFVQRAKQASLKIAHHALPFIKEDSTILTYGDSHVVHTLFSQAVEADRYFSVISIAPSSSRSSRPNHVSTLSIPTATIPLHAITYALSSLPSTSTGTQIIVGASAVLENGSIISRMGTHQLALLAKSLKIPFYVAVESYKFVRSFPLGYGSAEMERMGVRQEILRFSHGAGDDEKTEKQGVASVDVVKEEEEEMSEITPPELISALITENGIMTPNAVSEELIKLWF